jgi:hypothetical protein
MLGSGTLVAGRKADFRGPQEPSDPLLKLGHPIGAGHVEHAVRSALKAQGKAVNVLPGTVVRIEQQAFQPVCAVVVKAQVLTGGV